jgi:hypothetical protein
MGYQGHPDFTIYVRLEVVQVYQSANYRIMAICGSMIIVLSDNNIGRQF